VVPQPVRTAGGNGPLETFSPKEPFDVIRIDNVIEHLMDPKPILTKLRALLKPGGRLFIYVPNGGALSVRLLGKYSNNFWVPFHLSLFLPGSLQMLLEDVSFREVRIRTFSPVGSTFWTLRQWLLPPGYCRREPDFIHRTLKRLSLLFYPLEVVAPWFGMGEELVGETRA